MLNMLSNWKDFILSSGRPIEIPTPETNSKEINHTKNVHKCLSVLQGVRLFREMITDPEAQDIITAMTEDNYTSIIRCLTDQDIDGSVVAIRQLIDNLGSCDAVLERLNEKVPSLIVNQMNGSGEDMPLECVGASLSLALIECLGSKVDEPENLQSNAIVGECSPLTPLLSWPIFFGYSVLVLKKNPQKLLEC